MPQQLSVVQGVLSKVDGGINLDIYDGHIYQLMVWIWVPDANTVLPLSSVHAAGKTHGIRAPCCTGVRQGCVG